MFWKKDNPNVPTDENCANVLFHMLAESLKKHGRIRAEDMITAAASITGELCIEAAGNFNPRKHQFVPGSRIFSDKINELFSGDSADDGIDASPAESIVGLLRDRLLVAGYAKTDFPSLKMIFEHFASNVSKPSQWGKVPLSVPEGNMPFVLPLRVAYETRSTVDQLFQPLPNSQAKLRAAVLTLAQVLIAVRQAIDKKTALLLALQTVNGMAKTAPMTDEAMAAAKKKSEAGGTGT
jgi:hypothetical protein